MHIREAFEGIVARQTGDVGHVRPVLHHTPSRHHLRNKRFDVVSDEEISDSNYDPAHSIPVWRFPSRWPMNKPSRGDISSPP